MEPGRVKCLVGRTLVVAPIKVVYIYGNRQLFDRDIFRILKISKSKIYNSIMLIFTTNVWTVSMN